jgi:uncharacterized protein YegP (UPF0339 family)
MKFVICRECGAEVHHWKLVARNGRVYAGSWDPYATSKDARNAIQRLCRAIQLDKYEITIGPAIGGYPEVES